MYSRHKYLRIAILAIGLLVLFNCEEAVDEENLDILQTDILGSWEMTAVENNLEVTSSVDQDIMLLFSPGIGEITITGDLSASLTHLFVWDFGDYYGITAGNQVLGGGSLPVFTLAMSYSSGSAQSLSLSAILADSSMHNFATDTFVVTYDPTTFTLNISNVTLVNEDSSLTISIAGQLQMGQVHIPANTSTQFNFYQGLSFTDLGVNSTMVFQDNQVLQFIDIDTETAVADTQSGSWSLEGNELTFTTNDNGEVDIQIFMVALDGDELVLSLSEDCQDSADKASCLSEKENRYGFTSGTLMEFRETYVMRLSKIG